ncbi:seipin-like isoform X2 [Leucoraja erinacea]|uniref:seipin-like isoform X2 n=1 Tax=Leucoraja erinaceus TaxID=7782 RepID=UPI0024552DDF|nr:seipin-like isoform X2 [Leucoraja erinacea]
MPESPINQNLGMFMVQMSCYTKAGAEISTVSKSAMLRYKSGLLQLLDTLLYSPLFITGLVEQAQIVEVEFYSDYKEDSYTPTIGAVVEIQSRHIEIYKAQLQIRAYFTGIRYLLYSFPVMSAIIGVSTNFTFLCVLVLASYLHVMWGSLWQPARARFQSEDQPLRATLSSQFSMGRSQSLSVQSFRTSSPGSQSPVSMGSQHRTSVPQQTSTPRFSLHDEHQHSPAASAFPFSSAMNVARSPTASEHSTRDGVPMNVSAANQSGSRTSQPSLHGLPPETVGVHELPPAANVDTDSAQFPLGSRESLTDAAGTVQGQAWPPPAPVFYISLPSLCPPLVQEGTSDAASHRPTCPTYTSPTCPAFGPYPSKPVLSMHLSNCFLNIRIVPASTTSSGSSFHTPTTLCVE